MNKSWDEIKSDWVKELRSGNWEQGPEVLLSVDSFDSIKHCCLGVLACMLTGDRRDTGIYADDDGSLLDEDVVKTIGLPNRVDEIVDYVMGHNPDKKEFSDARLDRLRNLDSSQNVLAGLNDIGFTFDQIAQIIDEVL